MSLTISPLRLEWLHKLASNGPTCEPDMPRRTGGYSANSGVWAPMVEAGLIEIGQTRGPLGAEFTITANGLAALARITTAKARQS